MDHQTAPLPPPSISTTATTTTAATYPESVDSSPRSRNTDSWGDDTINNNNNNNNNQSATIQPPQPPPPQLTKLRLMCSYGGHIVPRPHDKSLCYVGGDTRIVVVDRQTSLSDLTNRLSKTLIRSSSNNSLSSSSVSISTTPQTASFTLKYQLPSEDLDSLISVTTDEDLENMIDEYERLLSNNSSSRLRLFLFPLKPESVSSIGSLLENTTKSEDWFLNALNGTTSGFSDTSSVNCLLGLDDDVLVNNNNDKKDVRKGNYNHNQNNNNSNNTNLGQDVHSVADLERTSSFGSASSSPSLGSLPPIKVHVDENKGVSGIEEQFVQMNLQQNVAVQVPVVVTGVPVSTNSPLAQTAYDLASQDSVLSDGRQKPVMTYQDSLVQMQVNGNNNNNRNPEMNNLQDQNARIQMQQQQQQQMADSAYLMSMGNTDSQHTQMVHQQPQFIHAGVPQPQYIHHHPSGAVPMTSYYQMYPPQSQHHPHHAPLDQQNFVYYMPAPAPARQAPQGYNVQMHQQQQQQQQQQNPGYAEVSNAGATPLSHSQAPQTGYTTSRPAQTGTKSDLPAGVYGTTTSGNPQFVQVPSSQHQPQVQPQYVGYSQMHHPSQSVASSASGASAGANYGYEFTDPAQGQHIYYAAQPLPPQSAAQYQTVTGEPGSYLPTDTSTKLQQQQGRGQQP